MKNIIINADDFGSEALINKAIIELFKRGSINSTTLMANMPGFEEAVELAHEHKIENVIGAHLNLTVGASLTEQIRSVSYLFDEYPDPDWRKQLMKKLFFPGKKLEDIIYKEYAAQIERIRHCGIKINHLDTHQHLHEMPGIMRVMIRLMKKYQIPSMRILNNLQTPRNHKYFYRAMINAYLKSMGINYSDYFGSETDFIAARMKNENFAGDRKVEIMVHPNYNSKGELIDGVIDKVYDLDLLVQL